MLEEGRDVGMILLVMFREEYEKKIKLCSAVCRHVSGTRRALLESSRRGGHFEYRRVHTRGVETPLAMADVMPK